MDLHYFNAKPYYDTEPIRDLMWSALPFPNDEMLDRILRRYHDDEDMRLVAVIDGDENVQGIIGLKLDNPGQAMILHLRVQDDAVRLGVGRALITKVIAMLELQELNGRSSEEILPFYTHLGFSTWIIGEKPPGHNWYGVRWERGDQPHA
jgi:GNAT superfamily N-acetyltransferase